MKCVVVTGITGSERREYLRTLKNRTNESEKLLIMDPWSKTKELYKNVNEATVLNMPDEDRLNYFKDAYKAIAGELTDLRKHQNQVVVVAVPTHSVFYWKSGFKDAIRDEFLEWLSPDLFITIIHNMKSIKANLDKDKYARFPEITFLEILHWRNREIQETSRWAKTFNKHHFVVARNEPLGTLYGILFTERKRIYFSYPMSYVTPRELEKAKQLIEKLRKLGYVVFDPSSIDDAKYVGELHKQVKARVGTITKDELSRIARTAGDHTVDLDYRLIEQSDVVVVRYPSVEYKKYIVEKDSIAPAIYVPLSAGVVCEMEKGNRDGKEVVAVWLPRVEPSPFFRYQCRKLFRREQDLLAYLASAAP
jgi:adenylate kinase